MVKYKILSGTIAAVIGTVSMLMSSCASDPNPNSNNVVLSKIKADAEARKFNLALVAAIQNADKIVIKEHSDKVDFLDLISEFEIAPLYTYSEKELNTGERILFLDDVRRLEGVAKKESSGCLFEAHHTIHFYEQDVLKSRMKICYKCRDIKWDGTNHKASQDVFEALTPVIMRAEMKTDRAWDALAKERYEKDNQVAPPNPDPKPGEIPMAKWAPGQIGKKVINPYTGKLVDVEGIPANTKVRDPNDRDPTHIFRVPGI